MAEWFQTFFGGLYGQVLAHQFDDKANLVQARLVKQLLHVRKGSKVLDIPCGMGRLVIPLARMGLVMTGVDLSEGYIRRARREAREKRVEARFVCCDMRDINFCEEFDSAINWFTSIGYFRGNGDQTFCRRVFQALKPGGQFLVETLNKSYLLAHFRPRFENTIGGVHLVNEVRWDPHSQRTETTWVLSKGNRTERHRVSIRLYGGAEMRRLLRSSGFGEIQLFGYPPLGRLTRHSKRLIAVAHRPRR
jgi:2-polyprenyl-3-methyl-5-hydroxy-6-metoxy-1,4-benzoquinol methylase